MSITRRTVNSIGWQSGSNILRVVFLFVRSTVLANLLAVDVFGTYGTAIIVTSLTTIISNFGIDAAFMHRSPSTEDEDRAAAVHFTLKVVFGLVWLVIMIGLGWVLFASIERYVFIAIAVATLLNKFTATPQLILRRRIVHRRLASIGVARDIATTIVAIAIAWMGYGVWALVSTNFVNAIVGIVLLYLWRPIWRPKFSLAADRVRYFLRFGSKQVGADTLLHMLDRVDDLWTRIFLGNYALGLYNRAYNYASYPSKIIAMPVNMVVLGSYAETKAQRQELSQLFVRVNGLLVRSGFLLGGLLALVAPEFIRILIGAKWLPFLDAFRLMLIFTLLDPIKVTIADLFVAVGRPEIVLKARLIQFGVMMAGLLTLASRFDIAGVALSVDLMILVGIGLLLWQARQFVDFSVVRIFGYPSLALFLGLLLGRAALELPGVLGSDWRTGIVKTVVFCTVYVLVLVVFERKQTQQILRMLRRDGERADAD